MIWFNIWTHEFTLYDEYRFKLQFFVMFLKKNKDLYRDDAIN